MSSPPSGSEPAAGTGAIERLHPEVQRRLHRAGWTGLRDAQERAVTSILEGKRDVLIAAATAAGKTEAAFLPICSALLARRDEAAGAAGAAAGDGPAAAGLSVLYLAPLKALINDQFERLEELAGPLGLPVHRWHGDVDGGRKQKLLEAPSGMLLITPESLEAMFVLRGRQLRGLFADLRYVVVDELHAFLGTERGRQLQSLLHRLEFALRRRPPRIGLSATLGDLGLAAAALRPGGGNAVEIIHSEQDGQELRLQLRGYRDGGDEAHVDAIATHLFRKLRGSNHLVFSNSRREVELYADRLRERCERERVPNEFLPHHGSLAKPLREQVEQRLKRSSLPFTAVCTSTLEMGIDIGDVASIAQIGAPFSVAALRQRLGRSGRRDGRPVLRLAVAEPDPPGDRALDGLRPALFQSVAMLELLLEGWCEPPAAGELHLSTLVHQVLSVLAQHDGATAAQLWAVLGDGSPFAGVDQATLLQLLRAMGDQELVEQSEDGTLMPGAAGERLLGHYSFYSVFESVEEYQVVHAGRALGTMAGDDGLVAGQYVVYAGRRWKLLAVDAQARRVEVEPAAAGSAPRFEPSAGGEVHGRIRHRMRELYAGRDEPRYLDDVAAALLRDGRAQFAALGLADSSLVEDGRELHLLVWDSDRVANTLTALLVAEGLELSRRGFALSLRGLGADELLGRLAALRQRGPVDAVDLATAVLNKRTAKYSWALSPPLLDRDYASTCLDGPGAEACLDRILAEGG